MLKAITDELEHLDSPDQVFEYLINTGVVDRYNPEAYADPYDVADAIRGEMEGALLLMSRKDALNCVDSIEGRMRSIAVMALLIGQTYRQWQRETVPR